MAFDKCTDIQDHCDLAALKMIRVTLICKTIKCNGHRNESNTIYHESSMHNKVNINTRQDARIGLHG
jgi:hypothetical protein